MAGTERPAGGDLSEQLEPDRVGERPEHLHGQVARLGDDPRRRQLARGDQGERAGDLGLGLGHGPESIAMPLIEY